MPGKGPTPGIWWRRMGLQGLKDFSALRFLLDPRVYDLLKEKLRAR